MSLRAAMQEAGIDTGAARAYTLTVDYLRQTPRPARSGAALARRLQHFGIGIDAIAGALMAAVDGDLTRRAGDQNLRDAHTGVQSYNVAGSPEGESAQPDSDTSGVHPGGGASPTVMPIASGSGHSGRALRGQTSSAPPARGPCAGFIRALGEAKTASARSLLDERKTSDGTLWGDIHARELPAMRRDGLIAKALQRQLGALNDRQANLTIRELLTADQAAMAFTQAERVNDD